MKTIVYLLASLVGLIVIGALTGLMIVASGYLLGIGLQMAGMK